ncbi:hypothetical protein WJX72_000110 [[Myrmecia] bisecta]|uniref:Uncharacterized protein n=1 Tax=[Myrmecia] bisecta TaxID=41462 RepID=A0AAW1PCD9_9CHLO
MAASTGYAMEPVTSDPPRLAAVHSPAASHNADLREPRIPEVIDLSSDSEGGGEIVPPHRVTGQRGSTGVTGPTAYSEIDQDHACNLDEDALRAQEQVEMEQADPFDLPEEALRAQEQAADDEVTGRRLQEHHACTGGPGVPGDLVSDPEAEQLMSMLAWQMDDTLQQHEEGARRYPRYTAYNHADVIGYPPPAN